MNPPDMRRTPRHDSAGFASGLGDRLASDGTRALRQLAGTVAKKLRDLHAIRLDSIRSGCWPAESVALWAGIAEEARQVHAAGRPLGAIHRRALDVDDAAADAETARGMEAVR